MKLRPHQVEAVDAVLRMLQTPPEGIPPEGLRTQVIAATGSGKTLIAVASAQRLGARRVLVLVPTRDLLLQMVGAWRAGGRGGAMVGVCALRAGESRGVPCTTDPGELVSWLEGLDGPVTVFATYASLGQGKLEAAHAAGLEPWDLVVVDEAHRTSGDAGKPWASIHDQGRIPAGRRLYMTATPRIWEASDAGRGAGQLVASMDAEGLEIFGPVAYRISLSECIRRGLVAPYRVICLDIRDPGLQQALVADSAGSDAVRGARLAALQTGVMSAAAQKRLRKVLTFHSRVEEAEAMAGGALEVAAQLHEEDPDQFPPVRRVWADWLYGEHAPARRRSTLGEFGSDVIEFADGSQPEPAVLRLLSSVRVLGEGVDCPACDSVAFCDARGSMVDIVQMVGRALRMNPGASKVASLIVPVFLKEGEEPGDMLASDSFGILAKILSALRAHDTEVIEALADPRVRSGNWREDDADGEDLVVDEERLDDGAGEAAGPRVSERAANLLEFSTPRDPAVLARFVSLRVLEPEKEYWLRGIEAAARWASENPGVALKVPYDVVAPDHWPHAGFPLGVWLADQRKYYNAGELSQHRIQQLDALGMVWNHQDLAFEEGLTVARAWAREHGHFLPSATAVWNGHPIGTWAKNMRTVGRQCLENFARLEDGQSVWLAGSMTADRWKALEDIDPGWCPVWSVGWQRAFRLTQLHLQGGGTLPTGAGQVVVQGEDLGRWVTAQRTGWDSLQSAQQYLLQSVLGLEPSTGAEPGDQPANAPTRDDKWALNLEAARAFHAREGHLSVPRKHVERLERPSTDNGPTGPQADGAEPVEVKLGMFLDNTRRRAGKLSAQRRAELDALGMRWTTAARAARKAT
ncbi:Helicase associated domain protein [Streptomyces sp. NPDC059991]|uniref:DEAD/DEAH box helicase n=1 Tax=Streptomyces sp. NPDC059991 TaxID=3347028 RepID=UPI0036A64261